MTSSGVAVAVRVFHSPSDIMDRGQLRTSALVKAGSVEWMIGSDKVGYYLMPDRYVAEGEELRISYGKNGRISGSLRWNASETLELKCRNVASESVAETFASFFSSMNVK